LELTVRVLILDCIRICVFQRKRGNFCFKVNSLSLIN
jgi:hypothetical protein